MDGEMHAANVAPVVTRDSRVFLIFQRQAQGVPVEVRQRTWVRAYQEDCRDAIDQEPFSPNLLTRRIIAPRLRTVAEREHRE
jgi:hypothetical protein